MANIINGTDTGSGGLITTGDSSDELQLQTAETARVTLTNTAVVVNEDGNDVDFRVEGDTDANLLFVDAGNDRVGVKTATPAVALDVVGQVRASTGILFGSDTAAANALDDYEEGTFTPTLTGGFSSGPTSYTQQQGRYVKIGRYVYFDIDLNPNGATADASGISIGGLPFTSSSGESGGANIAYQESFNLNNGDTWNLASSQTIMVNYTANGAGGRPGNAANVNINNRVILYGSYLV